MAGPASPGGLALLTAVVLAVLAVPAQLAGQPTVADENIVEASEELRDILYEREELREQLTELNRERSAVQAQLEAVDAIVVLQKQLDDARRQIEAAAAADQPRIEELEALIERLELKIGQRREIAEVDEELREVEAIRSETDDAWDDPIRQLLAEHAGRLQTLRDTSIKLHEVSLTGPESTEAELERRQDELIEEIAAQRVAVDIIYELVEAREEEDFDRIERLSERLKELTSRAPQAEVDDGAANDPSLQPVLVTAAELARVAHVGFDEGAIPLLRTHCLECHNQDTQSGELNIERMISERPIVKNRDKWINVIEQLKNRVMPPPDEPQPDAAARRRLVLVLHNTIDNFDYSGIRDPGFEMARRLTHEEYDNTVRDLFGIDMRLAEQFPSDLTGTSGFDNSANSLFIQPLLIERYMGAAEEIIDSALPARPLTAEQRIARAAIFGRMPANVEEQVAARTVLGRFLLRAYRRPPSAAEVARAVRLFHEARSRGQGFDDSIKGVLRTALVSPNFLIKNEQKRGHGQDYRVNDWELASRLSYFLWASMPDDELFDLARQGQLSEPGILRAQVDRMIADPKSRTLGTVFAAQWLGSQHVGTRVRLDPIDNPWCTETLMASMRDETAIFFHTLVTENHPIQRLVDADFTFVNQELARHYRMSNVKGEQMRRVSVDTSQRGGIFGQASLLAVTSFPYRTSPVVRGKWILDDVLGTPPPPPPPNASELSERIEENRRLSFRQKLELHRRSPNCYTCHSQMDPLGFSLENYDWFGRWRSKSRRRPVDARGKLPDGTEFEGIAGLKQVLVDQRLDDLHRQLTRKMLSYALGRQLEYYDEPAVRKILTALQADDYRMQTLVREIVASYPFQFKRSR